MSSQIIDLFIQSFGETLFMVGASGLLATGLGVPLGMFLHLSSEHFGRPATPVHRGLRAVIKALHTTPFIVLLMAIAPLLYWVAGSRAGIGITVIPLALVALPLVSSRVQAALTDIDSELIQEAKAKGASNSHIVRKILIPEASPGIVAAIGVTLASLVGYSTLAGAIGGSGLGNLGIRYGFEQFLPEVMLLVVLVLLALAETIHALSDVLSYRLSQR